LLISSAFSPDLDHRKMYSQSQGERSELGVVQLDQVDKRNSIVSRGLRQSLLKHRIEAGD
jgi:hypothetical protein